MPEERKQLRVNKSSLARIDLFELWLYSSDQWGLSQADSYLDEIEEGLLKISTDPYIGKTYEDAGVGIRGLRINHHLIYYMIHENHISVIRILHEKQSNKILM